MYFCTYFTCWICNYLMYDTERKPSVSGKRKNSKSGRSTKKAKRSSQAESSEDEGNISFDDEQVRKIYSIISCSYTHLFRPVILIRCNKFASNTCFCKILHIIESGWIGQWRWRWSGRRRHWSHCSYGTLNSCATVIVVPYIEFMCNSHCCTIHWIHVQQSLLYHTLNSCATVIVVPYMYMYLHVYPYGTLQCTQSALLLI